MLSYIGKRLLSLIPVMFVVSVVAFLVVYMIPGGPATAILGMEATPDQISALNAQLGFDRPFLVQYLDWFGNVLHGDWGNFLFSSDICSFGNRRVFWTNLKSGNSCTVFALILPYRLESLRLTKEEQPLT